MYNIMYIAVEATSVSCGHKRKHGDTDYEDDSIDDVLATLKKRKSTMKMIHIQCDHVSLYIVSLKDLTK